MTDLDTLLSDVLSGYRLRPDEALMLMQTRNRDAWKITAAADELRHRKVGDVVTWVKNQNVNVTNLCVNSCGFCGFSKKPGDEGVYLFNKETIQNKVAGAKERGVTEICTVSGLHPDFNAGSYIDIISWIHEAAPEIHIHASNPMEVAYGAAKSRISTRDMLCRMREAGLGSLCGTAAEILVDSVREIICPQKVSSDEWERIIREAHALGIPTTATIMYGHCESEADRIEHLKRIRDIQDSTAGFTEFVPLSFIHMNTPLYKKGIARAGATGREDVLMVAVARLFLDTFDHIQVSWVKTGIKMAQMGLLSGGDDLGGTMYEESISKGAGAVNTDYLDPEEMRRIAEDLGRTLCQRSTLYERI